jgi:hypothetical protein
MSEQPDLSQIRRRNGVAGQISYSVDVTYLGETVETLTFVGSVYGGPVVMVSPNGAQTFVVDPSRFGEFGPAWVRRFFGYEN